MVTSRVSSRLWRRAASLAFAAPVLVLAGACGSRGPLDVTIDEVAPDAGIDALAEGAVNTGDGANGGDGSPEGGGGPGLPDSGPVACGTCVINSCGMDLLSCIASTDCEAALQCIATTCVMGGTPDPLCIAGCSNDPAALGQAITGLTCVLTSCGPTCAGLLGAAGGGGLGGLGGGGGGGGGGG